jgi:DEAD/DEAH box helicase domain-containing protein
MVEVLTKYLKDVFDHDPRLPPRIRAYRGGYLPTERREAERAMREGKVDGIVSTSALELGVDIGSLDVVVLNGYPGSIAGRVAALRPRGAAAAAVAGRAGGRVRIRSTSTSCGIRNSSRGRRPSTPASTRPGVDPARPHPLRRVRAAVPARRDVRPGRCGAVAGGARRGPACCTPRASAGSGSPTAIRPTRCRCARWPTATSWWSTAPTGAQAILAEVDFSSAPLMLYEGAIHMIQSTPYQVERLDWEGRKAYVTRTHVDYYTDAIDYTKLKVLERFDGVRAGDGSAQHGEVHVVRRVAGYKKIRYYTHENIGYGPSEPAGRGDAHHRGVVAAAAGGAGGGVRVAAGGARRVPRRGVCAAYAWRASR